MTHLILILDNIRSAHNVGAIFRTADGCGVQKIYLCGYTPTPFVEGSVYKTKGQKELAKTALGAEEVVPWEHVDDAATVVALLQKEGYQVVALEQAKGSIPYDALASQEPCALIVGNEVDGVDPQLLPHCDAVIEIPMRGTKESLNVSVACGIACYTLIR